MYLLTFRLRCGFVLATGFALMGCDSHTPDTSEKQTRNVSRKPEEQPPLKQRTKPAALHLLDQPTRHVIAKNAIQPHVAVNAQGNIAVAFIHKGNIVVSTSTDRGKTFSDPIVAMDVKGHARGGRQRGPRIGVDGDNKLYVTAPVTFDPVQWRKKYPRTDMYLATSEDGGKTWRQPIRVNEAPTKAPEALHWLAVAPSGTAHIAWLDLRDRNQRGQDIYYAKFTNGKVSKNTPVARTVCECCAPGLSVDDKNNPFLAFREGGNKDSRELFVRHSSDQGASFSKQVKINQKESREFG